MIDEDIFGRIDRQYRKALGKLYLPDAGSDLPVLPPASFTDATLAARLTDAMAADYPILWGHNVARDAAAIEWRSGGSWNAGSDESEVGAEARWAIDGFGVHPTRPNAARTDHYLLLRWAGTGADDFDMLAALGISGMPEGSFIAWNWGDDAAFASWDEFGQMSITAALETRLVDLDLNGPTNPNPSRLTGLNYLQVHFFHATIPFVPEITEIVMAKRCQLMHKPDAPWSGLDSVMSGYSEKDTLGGILVRNENYAGRIAFEGMLPSNDTQEQTDLREWAASTRWGVRTWGYTENPTSEPNRTIFGFSAQPGFALPNPPGYPNDVRDFALSFVETAPFLRDEEES